MNAETIPSSLPSAGLGEVTGAPEFIATAIHYGSRNRTGEFTATGLIVATSNALNGAAVPGSRAALTRARGDPGRTRR